MGTPDIPKITLQNGVEMPLIGLGTFQLIGRESRDAVISALKLGYRHIDTAEVYGNHSHIADAIKDVPRSTLFITSKVPHNRLVYQDVLDSCDQALEELGVDYLDLYLVHWPNRAIPMQETFDALNRLFESGKIRAIGVSNFTVRHLKDALKVYKGTISVNQVEFHPLLHQKDLIAFCRSHDIQIVAYSPLGQGVALENEAVQRIAKKYGKTPAQISLRWLLQKGLVVIPRSRSRTHQEENLGALGFELSEEDARRLDDLPHHRVVVPSFAEFDYV